MSLHIMSYDMEEKEKAVFLQNRIEGREKFLDNYKREIEDKAYEMVRIYSLQDGISHQNLADLLRIHRTNLTRYTDRLMEKNKIYRKNKKGKYFAIDDISKDPILNASILADTVRFNLLRKTDNYLILNEKKESEIPTNFHGQPDREGKFPYDVYDFTLYKKLFEPHFTKNDKLEKMLFEFSNKIGSFITYLLIYSMNFNNNINSEISDKVRTGEENDAIVKKMVEEGIVKLIPFLPFFFKDSIDKSTGKYPNSMDIKIKKEYLKKSPRFVIDKGLNYNLINAFNRLYPLMSYELESILPQQFRLMYGKRFRGKKSGLDQYKEYLNEYHASLSKQENCKHEYVKKSKTSHYQCKLCNHIKKSKKLRNKI